MKELTQQKRLEILRLFLEGYSYDDISAKKKFLDNKTTVLTLSSEEMSKMRQVAQPLVDKAVEAVEKKGLPGKEAYQYYQSQLELYGVR